MNPGKVGRRGEEADPRHMPSRHLSITHQLHVNADARGSRMRSEHSCLRITGHHITVSLSSVPPIG